MNYCQKCGSQISDSAVFCKKCGAKQEKTPQVKICSNPGCGNEMPAGMVFCDKCGTKYTAPVSVTNPYTHSAGEAARKSGEGQQRTTATAYQGQVYSSGRPYKKADNKGWVGGLVIFVIIVLLAIWLRGGF